MNKYECIKYSMHSLTGLSVGNDGTIKKIIDRIYYGAVLENSTAIFREQNLGRVSRVPWPEKVSFNTLPRTLKQYLRDTYGELVLDFEIFVVSDEIISDSINSEYWLYLRL